MPFDRDRMEAAFRDFAGGDPARTGPRDGFSAMVDWYRSERPLDAEPMDQDGDMLLFQWSSKPDGIWVDLTRQVIWLDLADPDDEEGEPVFMQLSLAYRFSPDAGAALDGSGNRWCHSIAQLDEFLAWMVEEPAYRHAVAQTPIEVELKLHEV
ncbi:MAG: hypothetical protein ACO25F_06950 [Erythrobacter sp.]